MRIRLLLSCAMLCLSALSPGIAVQAIPRLSATAAAQGTVSVTFANDVGWEAVYAYAWTTTDGTTTEHCGSWPGMLIEAGADGTYVYECDENDAPAYIIFNNGSGGDGNQTADLVFQNGKSYSYMGDHEFADGEYLLRNVGSDRYLGAGNDWGTRASLLVHTEYVRLVAAPNGRYHIESQYSDGEGRMYFSGNYMDSSDKATLTIARTDAVLRTDGQSQTIYAYTIANGETYYGYDGSSAILAKLTDTTGDNTLWEIVSVEDAKTALTLATADAPRDATFLIADANFGRNNRNYSQWTFEADNQNNAGDVTNFCVESWHATFTMSQTLTGVPNGVYALSAQGFYRQDGSDEEHLPVFFANDATATFLPMSGSENSMEDASHSFSNGLYTIDPIYVIVTDGTLTIGARLADNTSLWCIWDNFCLSYYGSDADIDIKQMVFDQRFAQRVQEAAALQGAVGITTTASQMLSDAMTAYNGIDKSTPTSTQKAIQLQMDEAIAYAEEGLRLVETMKATYARWQQQLSGISGDGSLTTLLATIASAIDNEHYESNEQVSSWTESLVAARIEHFPYEFRYWFDDALDNARIEYSEQPGLSLQADVNDLTEGIHAFHVQAVNAVSQPSTIITRMFLKTVNEATSTGRYWFDDNVSQIYSTAQMQGMMEIDVSQLEEGFHTIHYQVKGVGSTISQTVTYPFFKVFMPSNCSWLCWADDDISTLQTGSGTGHDLILDVSSLGDGFHQLHIQVDGGSGSLSTPRTIPFVKIPQVIGINEMTCLAMADDQVVQQERVHADGGNMSWQVDVSGLPQGFHRLLLQTVTPSGAATNTWQTFFLREATHAELADMKCVYAIDGAEFYTEAGTLADDTYHFDLDVSALDDGLHRLAYMLNNGKGVTTKAQTQFFVKIPVGGYGITDYWYWLNDNDVSPSKVSLPERQDPFSFISLLPVESQPLRSSLFQFRVENGQPVVYAKNDFHIRFYDASGRFTDATRQYVDEQVSQAVTDVTLLESGVRATTDRPAENGIKWYYLTAEPGDSLSFILDCAATLQLFSPTGKEVYSASGNNAVNWGGIHAEEAGTYYVALHDVTATYGYTVSINYEHIDRYAVLRQDVATVGNGGPSTITFQGNGYDELTSVDLVLDGTTIASAEIEADGKATVSVKWDFTDAPLGQYKAVFHFAEGNVTVENCIRVEEAIPVSIASSESHAVQFLVSQGNTYNYKIKNQGNMTAYDVPMVLTVYASDEGLLSWVMADGTELSNFEEVVSLKEGYAYARQYQLTRSLRPSTAEALAIKVKTSTTAYIYVDLDGVGSPSEAVTSIDPNDIYGYQDEFGSKVIRGGLTNVYYTIEFENDPEFATASAHDIYVSDQLDPQLFDLSTFAPTRIKIGEQEVTLTDEERTAQVVTINMQPAIYAIAQVAWEFDAETGLAEWHISSLDPMTMEPTTVAMDGVLPVNHDGNGIGELSFDISLKPNLPDGTEIPNKATITFDENEPIETPTWVNVISTSDELMGDVNGDGVVDTQDAIKVIQHYLKKNPADFDERAADVNGDGTVDTQDAIMIIKIYLKKE